MTSILESEHMNLCKIKTDSITVLNWVKSSPSRVREKGIWLYPITELNDVFEFCNNIKEDVYVEQTIYEKYQNFLYKLKILKELREGKKKFDVTSKLFKGSMEEKFEYQKNVVGQMLLMHKYLPVLDVGLGKTAVACAAFSKLRDHKPVKVLILCEAGQVHKPWVEHLFNFTRIKKQELLVLQGTVQDRKAILSTANREKKWLWIVPYSVLIIEKENIPKDWDVIILDEVTKVKRGPGIKHGKRYTGAQVAGAVSELHAEYRWGLSATPYENAPLDLYGIMKAINPLLFTTKQNFIRQYLEEDIFGRPIRIRNDRKEILRKKLDPWYVQLVTEDVEDHRPIHFHSKIVEPTKAQEEVIKNIHKKIDDLEVSHLEATTLNRMVCASANLCPEFSDLPLEQATNKIFYLDKIVDEIVHVKKKKIVIFTFFRKVAKQLEERFAQKGYRVRKIWGTSKKTCSHPPILDCKKCTLFNQCVSIKKFVYEFVEGDVEILIGTDSISKAHNFKTCDTIVNFDLPWRSSDLKQRIGRIKRASNPATEFYVYNLVTQSTIEEKIVKIIERKEKEAGKIFPKYNVKIAKLSKTLNLKVNKVWEM